MARYLGDDFLLPTLTEYNEPFFTAGSIQIQKCDDCGHTQQPPDDVCYGCQGTNLAFAEMPGTGRVESAVLVHHPIHPALKERVPYVIAVVSVDGAPGCSVTGNVVGCPPESVEIGAKVRAVFEQAKDPASGQEFLIPQWELAAD
jgi:uncharacterized OB-fold protein